MDSAAKTQKVRLCSLKSTGRPLMVLALMFILSSAMLPIVAVNAQDLLFDKTWGGTSIDIARSVAVDSSGNIYVTGDTGSFGAGGADVFLLKYSSSGALLWQKTWGGSTDPDYGQGVAVDLGSIYVVGRTKSFGTGGGSDDVFLLKYSPDGALVWQKTWGGTSTDQGLGVAAYSGSIYVTGATNSFGAGYEAILLEYNSAGLLQWQKKYGGTSDDFGFGVAVDSSGNSYFVGYTIGCTRILSSVSGTETGPSGTVTSPAGSECAGLKDAFLLKFSTRRPVGGVLAPVNKLSILMPYLALAALVGVAATIVKVKKNHRD